MVIARKQSGRDGDDVASVAGLSDRSLQRLFRAEIGIVWRDFVREDWVPRALESLTHRRALVGDVARRVGFPTSAAFATALVKRFGMIPTDNSFRRDAAS